MIRATTRGHIRRGTAVVFLAKLLVVLPATVHAGYLFTKIADTTTSAPVGNFIDFGGSAEREHHGVFFLLQ